MQQRSRFRLHRRSSFLERYGSWTLRVGRACAGCLQYLRLGGWFSNNALYERTVSVLKGQSLHFDCYLQPGPVIHGNVFTKHQFGDEPWPGNSTSGQYIKIELYSNATLSNQVDPSAGPPVSWSPLPCVAGGQELYYGRRAAGLCGDPRTEAQSRFHGMSTAQMQTS